MSTAEQPQEEPSPSSRQRGGGEQPTGPSPRSGTNSAPIRHERAVPALAFRHHYRAVPRGGSGRHAHHHHPRHQLISASLSPPLLSSSAPNNNNMHYNNLPNSPSTLSPSPLQHLSLSASAGGGSPSTASHSPALRPRRLRPVALGRALSLGSHSPAPTTAPAATASSPSQLQQQQRPLFTASLSPRFSQKKLLHHTEATQQTQLALQQNDAMVYLEGPNVYACQQCRTHLTSHDDIISKSFHGRNGRAYLLNSAVNVRIGPSEDRMLMTGLHSVCDIFCQRCNTLIGWTYQKAYEASQKYKEGKFIIEKINLYLDDQDGEAMSVGFDSSDDPFKERRRRRSSSDNDNINHGNHHHKGLCPNLTTDVYEYYPSQPPSSSETTSAGSAGRRSSSTSLGTGAASF